MNTKSEEIRKKTRQIVTDVSEDKIKNLIPEILELEIINETVKKCLSMGDPIPKFNNLYMLVASESLIRISCKKLVRTRRASIHRYEEDSNEDMSNDELIKLSERLKNYTFKWSPIKKLKIQRKNKKTYSIRASNFSEKIVQNNILMILEAIYEPIFEKLNCSFCFRPHKSCEYVIKKITENSEGGIHTIIGGDIRGTFDYLHPPKLAKILQEYIEDKDLINLIYNLYITLNIKDKEIIKPSLEDISQVSILSPILFNIYMHKFDEFIIKELTNLEIETGGIEANIKLNLKYINLVKKYKILIENLRNIQKNRNINRQEKITLNITKLKLKKILKKRSKLNCLLFNRVKFRYYYVRYADNFIILINQLAQFCEKIKRIILKYLNEQLFLHLSDQKIIITNIREKKHVKFLGSILFMTKKNLRLSMTALPGAVKQYILVGIDEEQIYNKLVDKNFAKEKTLRPISCGKKTPLDPQIIIENYNSIMLGITNYYYGTITNNSKISRILYILYYSCLFTLAAKFKISLNAIYKKYGWPEINEDGTFTQRTRIIYSYKVIDKENIVRKKYSILNNYIDTLDIIENIHKTQKLHPLNHAKIKELTFNNRLNKYKVNGIMKFKRTESCTICRINPKLRTITTNLQNYNIKNENAEIRSKSLIILPKSRVIINQKQRAQQLCKNSYVRSKNTKITQK